MTFLQPLAFLGLLLFIPVILLYLLKQRRRRVRVSTLLFWDEILRDEHRVASVTRLRKLLSLLLQLLVLLLLVLALARPLLTKDVLGARRIVLLLDVSASMLVDEGGQTRFDLARERVRDVIAGMASGDTAMLVAAGAHPGVVMSFSSSRRTLQEALDHLVATHAPADFNAAFRVLEQLPPDARDTCVYVVSDGAFDSVALEVPEDMQFAFLSVGQSADNVGITAFQVRPLPALPRDFEILFEVVNESDRNVTLPFELRVGDNLVDANEITIAARGTYTHAMRQFSATGGAVELFIESNDAFELDNHAYAVLPPAETAAVALVTEGNYFLESALLTDDGIELETMSPAEYPARAGGLDADVWIFDGWAPEDEPDGSAIYVGQWPAGLGISVEGDQVDPIITAWDQGHPVNRHLQLSNVTIESGKRLRAPERFTPLVESFDQPLVLLDESGPFMTMVVGFNTATSNLPLRVAFPILVANSIRYMTGDEETDRWETPAMGTVLGVSELASYAGDATLMQVFAPEESPDEAGADGPDLSGAGNGLAPVSVETAGIYRGITATGDTIALFGASVCDRREADIAVAESLPVISDPPLREIADDFRIGAVPWRLVAWAALALLLLEWACFHRRWVE